MDSCPLAVAAQEGHTETVQRLLQAGAIVNHQNEVCACTHQEYVFRNEHLFPFIVYAHHHNHVPSHQNGYHGFSAKYHLMT